MATIKANDRILGSWFNVVINVYKEIFRANTSWFKKITACVIYPIAIIYMFIAGIIKLVLYPVLYALLFILVGESDLKAEVKEAMKLVWSKEYWK